jgi:glycosyltransferase involved in cell wall biosynthesis
MGAEHFLRTNTRDKSGVVSFLRSYSEIYRLNALPSSQIVELYGNRIRRSLGRRLDAIPTLVCARNEEQDLPRLLYALAQNDAPPHVVVVDNQSSDGTAELASHLGATVIKEPKAGICNALATGIEFMAEAGQGRFLLTDADTYPTNSWTIEMEEALRRYTGSSGGEVFGPVVYYGKKAKDNLRSLITITLDLKSKMQGKARAHGPNAAISLDSHGELAEAIIEHLRSNQDSEGRFKNDFISDQVIRDVIISMGGKAAFHLSTNAIVLARGDRYPTVLSILKAALSPQYKKDVIYGEWKGQG